MPFNPRCSDFKHRSLDYNQGVLSSNYKYPFKILLFLLLTLVPTTILCATVQGLDDPSLTLDQPLLEPFESNTGPVVETVSNASFLYPNLNNSDYELPFDYPDLDLGSTDTNLSTNAEPECKESLGVNLSRFSCSDAYNRMRDGTATLTWGQRGTGNFQVRLPFRVSSIDGFCAIDIVHGTRSNSDFATLSQVKQAANQVINGCIRNGPPNTGGLIRNVGV